MAVLENTTLTHLHTQTHTHTHTHTHTVSATHTINQSAGENSSKLQSAVDDIVKEQDLQVVVC